MSNIIKSSAYFSSHPKVIELSVIGSVEAAQPIKSRHENDTEEVRGQIAALQMESQKVLQETEAMIVDLLEKARDEAGSIMEAARDEAELMRIQASQAAQEMRNQAQEDGYREGLEKARREMAELQALSEETSRALLEEARMEKLNTIRACEADILRLSLAIAKKVVAAEIQANPEVILQVIREAIALLDNPDNISVYVNPAELEQVLEGIGAGIGSVSEAEVNKLRVLPDNRIKKGGCSVESEAGTIDATIDTRLANMEQLIQEVNGDD